MALRPLTTLALGMLLFFVAPAPMELVFCLGSNGHSELELAGFGNCFDCFKSDHQEAAELEAQDHKNGESHCGSCTDLALDPDPSGSNRLQLKVLAPILAIHRHPPAITPFAAFFEADAPLVDAVVPLDHQRMDSIRSVILLI